METNHIYRKIHIKITGVYNNKSQDHKNSQAIYAGEPVRLALAIKQVWTIILILLCNLQQYPTSNFQPTN